MLTLLYHNLSSKHKNGALEVHSNSRTAGPRVSQQKRAYWSSWCGANEETLTLDLFLGKEAL